jgi:hypothetical protein
MSDLREMLQAATHRHRHNDVRDLTPFSVRGMSAEDVGKLLADQPGNRKRGKSASGMQKRWVVSQHFLPMQIPLMAVQPVRIPSGETESHTVGPIIVEANEGHRPQLDGRRNDAKTGRVPPVIVIDGQHRWEDAAQEGREWIQALVGDKALPRLNGAVLRTALRHPPPESNVQRLARALAGRVRYAEDFKEAEHPRDATGEFTSKGGAEGGGYTPLSTERIHELLRERQRFISEEKSGDKHVGSHLRAQIARETIAGFEKDIAAMREELKKREGVAPPPKGLTAQIDNILESILATGELFPVGHRATNKDRTAALKAREKGWIEAIPHPEVAGAILGYRLTDLGKSVVGRSKPPDKPAAGSELAQLLRNAQANQAASRRTKKLFSRVRYQKPTDLRLTQFHYVEPAPKAEQKEGHVCEHCCHWRYNPGKCSLFRVLELPATVLPDASCIAFV